MKASIMPRWFKAACAFFAAILIAGCVTTTPQSTKSSGNSRPLQGKAAIYFNDVRVYSMDSKMSSNYRRWIRELMGQAFLQAEEIDQLENVAQSRADVVVIVDFFHVARREQIENRIDLSVRTKSDEELFSRSNSSVSSCFFGGITVNDNKHAANDALAPVILELLANNRIESYLSMKPSTGYAARFSPPRDPLLATLPPTPEVPQATIAPSTVSSFKDFADREAALPARGLDWAIVVGVSEYKDSRVPPLRYAEADAHAFYDWLTSQDGGRYAPARVKLLAGREATAKNIRMALFQWLKQAIEEDVVTVFFAGHGSPESPDSPENLYLLPYDVEYDNIAATAFPMWDIETALKRHVKAKSVIVIADACHSGGVGQAFDIVRRSSRGIEVVPVSSSLEQLSNVAHGICVISASGDSELSQEGSQWGGGHGVFTHYLLQGLKGEADTSQDSKVSLGELTLYVSQEVRRATKNAQCPTVAGKFDPALTIGR